MNDSINQQEVYYIYTSDMEDSEEKAIKLPAAWAKSIIGMYNDFEKDIQTHHKHKELQFIEMKKIKLPNITTQMFHLIVSFYIPNINRVWPENYEEGLARQKITLTSIDLKMYSQLSLEQLFAMYQALIYLNSSNLLQLTATYIGKILIESPLDTIQHKAQFSQNNVPSQTQMDSFSLYGLWYEPDNRVIWSVSQDTGDLVNFNPNYNEVTECVGECESSYIIHHLRKTNYFANEIEID